MFDGGHNPKIIEYWRMEFAREASQIVRDPAQSDFLLLGTREHLEMLDHSRQLLQRGVVQLPSEASSLSFSGRDGGSLALLREEGSVHDADRDPPECRVEDNDPRD
jgi:hypothetical protein